MKSRSKVKFLVVRRDNIGDLVCTTPIFGALRGKFPDAFIAAFVNSYNAEVLARNPHVDAIYAYTKAKHRDSQSLRRIYWQRLILLLRIRREQFDYVIVAGIATTDLMRLVRFIRPRRIIRFPTGAAVTPSETIVAELDTALHETWRTLALLKPLGAEAGDTPLQIYPDESIVRSLRGMVLEKSARTSGPLIGIHISARKPSQRWPLSRFIELVRGLHLQHDASFLLLWSPGNAANKQHPGDDEKAAVVAAELHAFPSLALPTPDLSSLVAALSLCDQVVCSDGGTMHIAAALQKPIVCLFGDSDARRWHPLGVNYRLLQPASLDVIDITAVEVLDAYDDLIREGTNPSRS